MKPLLTNDDGIDAPGLAALYEAARAFGEPIVAAPTLPLSGCSHRVTTHQPLRLIPHGPDRYAVDGTPADCVRVALHRLLREPTWILSGINAGGNLGADVHHSGTVAAVREGALHGCPGVAFSHYLKKGVPIDWTLATRWAERVLRDLLKRPVEPGTYWSVNFPHLAPGTPEPEIVYCSVDPSPLPLSFREEDGQFHYDGNYHDRKRLPGHDVDVCFSGRIAVSRLSLS